MRNYLKKFIVGLLVMAMTITSIEYTPVKVFADDNATLYCEYDGTGSPYLLFASEIDGKTSDFQLWSKYAYALENASETLGENWYSFEVDKDVLLSGFQVAYSTDGTAGTGIWVSNVGLGGGTDALTLLTDTIGDGYTVYADSKFTACGTTYEEYQEAVNAKVAEYYIAGAMFPSTDEVYKMTEEDGVYVYELGEITSDTSGWVSVYTDTALTGFKQFGTQSITAGYVKFFVDVTEQTLTIKSYTDDTYTTEVPEEVVDDTVYYVLNGEDYEAIDGTTYKYGAVSSGYSVSFAVYTFEDDVYTEFASVSFDAENDGYVLFTIDEANKVLTYEYYTDDTYTNIVGETPVDKEYYIGLQGNKSTLIMTKESDGIFYYELGEISTSYTSVNFGIYADETWNDEIVGFGSSMIYSDGYGRVYYYASSNTVELKIYYDSDYSDYIENTSEAPEFFLGYKDNMKPMEKEDEGLYSYKYGSVNEGTLEFGIYGATGAWSDEVVGWSSYVINADGYLKGYYNSVEDIAFVKIYTDDTYTTEVDVEDTIAKVHVYYPGTDKLTIAFWTSTIKSSANYDKLGTPYDHTYWTRTCYPMTKDEENWYSFEVYKSYGGFQIVANPQDEVYPDDSTDKENTVWLINVGDAGDEDRYNTLFASGETYIMYNTMFESKEAAEAYDDAFSWDYYISGSTSDFEDDINAGIFSNYWSQDNYAYDEEEGRYKGEENWLDQMTKSGTTLSWISSKKAEKFKSYTMNIYADKSWFGKTGKDFAFLAVADSYVKITYDLKTKVYTVAYYDDAEGTVETEFDEITIYYYYGSDDAKNLTLVLNATVEGKKVVGTYWGRNAYAMASIGDGWYQFKGYKALYGGFQIVDDPHGEDYSKGDTADNDDTTWFLDIGDYGDVSTADSDLSKFFDLLAAGNKAYIKYNKIFKTQSAAESFTDWTYYVAGSTNAFTNTASGRGIFSNYWAGDFEEGVDEETGEAYTKKVDTWPDVLVKEKEDVYSIVLGKAVKGTTYEFNIYTEKDWNALNLSGLMGKKNPSFEATSNNYVKLYFYRDLKTGNNTWEIKYYTDKECKNQAKLAAPKNLKLVNLKPNKGAKLKLAWSAVSGASSYVIYANGKKVGTSKTNSKVLKYKKQGKTIKYTVVAMGSEYGTSDASAVFKVKTPKKVAKKGLKAKNQKKGILIKWKKVKASNGYVIYRSTKKKKGFKKLTVIKKAKTVKFLDKKAKSGKKYYYRVYAFRKNGKKKVYSAASKTISAKKK